MSKNNKFAALFLDRDGVLIEDAGYVKDPSKVTLISGICELLHRAQADHNLFLIGVTNQSGIGRGWISIDDYKAVSLRMQTLFSADKVFLDKVFFAPYFAESPLNLPDNGFNDKKSVEFVVASTTHKGRFVETWRKPNIGMLEAAQAEFQISLQDSFLVGDRLTDMQLAQRAQLKKFFLKKSHAFATEYELIKQWRAESHQNENWYQSYVQVIDDYQEVKFE